nr:WbqC family protein [Pigmentibacter ruber]
MKKIAIVQSNYIPWKGYFDLIAAVDEFILYDDVQFTKRDWRNRNQIKTPQGPIWLTVPVNVKGKYYQTINETEIHGTTWVSDHWKSLIMNYKRADYFKEVSGWLEEKYFGQNYTFLSDLNKNLIDAICKYLNIKTVIKNSSDFLTNSTDKTERIIELCQQSKATEYISGPSAKNYLNIEAFNKYGISVKFFDYEGFKPYNQLWGDFIHNVSIIDLLFNCGKDSKQYLRFIK